jgi:large subunit ribosomal protein L21
MYAIIQTGGKQYRVQPGDVIRVEKLENALGSEFEISDVLLVGGDATSVGAPLVKGAKVTVVVTKQTRDKKVFVFKKKRRQGYRRFGTHKQPFTELFVKAISLDGKTAKAETDANVVDVDKTRTEKISARTETKKARVSGQAEVAEKPAKKTAKKAVAKKAPAKKAGAKKAAKKTTKKKTTK